MATLIPHLTVAYGLDLLLGDPQWFPHPVRIIGWVIERGEHVFRKWIGSESAAGTILTSGLVLLSFSFTYACLKFLSKYSINYSTIAEIFLLYSCFSTKDLAVESGWVKNALESKNISLARRKLSWIVGRDTEQLDEPEIIRATVETIAENSVDGVIAPIFYAVIGGAPLVIAYKSINTLDSMIGHKDEKYIRFGKFAAMLDTLANWIPARISGFLFPIASGVSGFSLKNSYKAAWQKETKWALSNSAIPEAAMAGALSIQLGGTNFYKGQSRHTPKLGDALRPLSIENISESVKIMVVVSFVFFLFGLAARFFMEKYL